MLRQHRAARYAVDPSAKMDPPRDTRAQFLRGLKLYTGVHWMLNIVLHARRVPKREHQAHGSNSVDSQPIFDFFHWRVCFVHFLNMTIYGTKYFTR